MKKTSLLIVFIALFAAIICVGGFMRIPLGPVPVVLQNGLAVLTGVLLGGYRNVKFNKKSLSVLIGILLGGLLGGAPTLLFIIAGIIGLPVFSGGTSGMAVLLGPTGGFIPGYLIGAVIAGFIAGKPSVMKKRFNIVEIIRVTVAMLTGMIVLYVPGIIHFANWAVGSGKITEDQTAFSYTMAKCVIPFIPGDLLKVAVGVVVALAVRPVLAQYLYSEPVNEENTSTEHN